MGAVDGPLFAGAPEGGPGREPQGHIYRRSRLWGCGSEAWRVRTRVVPAARYEGQAMGVFPLSGERDLLRAGDAPLDGCLVHAEEGRQPHPVLHHDNVSCPLPAFAAGKLGFGIPYQCREPIEVSLKRRRIDHCKIFMCLRKRPKVETQ